MNKDNDNVKFTIEGNPGHGNTFVTIGHVENYNPSATTVTTTINNNYYGMKDGGAKVTNSGDRKLGNMTIREMLVQNLIDTGNIQKEIVNYVSCIRPYVKDEMSKLYMRLWTTILDDDAFKIDLYDPGKQPCKFNRNLVANIFHYLDSKGFYKEQYNSSAMTRSLEGDDQHAIRKALRFDPEEKYCNIIDTLIKELKEK